MKSFYKLFFIAIASVLVVIISANILLEFLLGNKRDKSYAVEVNRISYAIENGQSYDLSDYNSIKNVTVITDTDNEKIFYEGSGDACIIRFINDTPYRFDCEINFKADFLLIKVIVNIILVVFSALLILGLLFIRHKILKPFNRLSEIPYELSKGNLTIPMKEEKSRYFGRFVWGVNMLQENLEEQRKRELELQREKKTLLMSISHDIKTPLSAIKLYSKALSVGLYTDKEKQLEISESINKKADEIENFITELMTASSEDFMQFNVASSDFYINELLKHIEDYYTEKLKLLNIDFEIGKTKSCIIHGDLDRAIEVIQNLIENAIKYGDGHYIRVEVSTEEDCKLISVINSGCTLSETELPHIFDSFWRGSNTKKASGSGLGLYICKQLMKKMDGEIYARIEDADMIVTAVFRMA